MKYLLSKLLVLTAIAVLLTYCSGQQEADKKAPVAVRAFKPQQLNLAERLSYLGTIHARREVTVIAQVQGTVQSLPLAEGAEISKGGILARLYAPELEAAVQRLQADRDYWNKRYETDKRLLEQKAIPSEQLEASRRASSAARAAYEEAASRLKKTIEKSAFNGFVLKWFVEPGQHVMPGQPLLLIGDARYEIRVNVIEEDVRRGLRTGSAAEIRLTDGTRRVGRIAEIAPMAEVYSRTVTVKIHWFEEEALFIRYGAATAVDFILKEQKRALAVPVGAVATDDGGSHLYLIRDKRAYKQPVQTGIEENGWVAVEFDWNGSDLVAATNLNSLSDSVRVFSVPMQEVK